MLPTVLIQLVMAYIFFDRHWDNVVRHMAGALAGEAAFLVHQLELMPERVDGIVVLGGGVDEAVSEARGHPTVNHAADRLVSTAMLVSIRLRDWRTPPGIAFRHQDGELLAQ